MGKHRNLYGESDAAFKGAASREKGKKPQETSSATTYEELRAECERLRRENKQLHIRLEVSERRLAASSSQHQGWHEDSRESIRLHDGPMVKMTIQGLDLIALADDDCQVSCLLGRYYEENISTLGSCLVLPAPNTYVEGLGGKLIRVKKQILATLQSGNMKHKTLLLVVPQLNTSCVLGQTAVKALATRSNPEEDLLAHTEELESSDNYIEKEKVAAKLPVINSYVPPACRTTMNEETNLGMSSSRDDELSSTFIKQRNTLPFQLRRKTSPSRSLTYKDLNWRFRYFRCEP